MNTQEQARLLMVRRDCAIKKRQQSLLTKIGTEIGLNTKNLVYCSRIQGKIHPSFRKDYASSSMGMS